MKYTFFPITMSITKPVESIIFLKHTVYMHIYLNHTDIMYFKVYFRSWKVSVAKLLKIILVFSQLELKGNLSISFSSYAHANYFVRVNECLSVKLRFLFHYDSTQKIQSELSHKNEPFCSRSVVTHYYGPQCVSIHIQNESYFYRNESNDSQWVFWGGHCFELLTNLLDLLHCKNSGVNFNTGVFTVWLHQVARTHFYLCFPPYDASIAKLHYI